MAVADQESPLVVVVASAVVETPWVEAASDSPYS